MGKIPTHIQNDIDNMRPEWDPQSPAHDYKKDYGIDYHTYRGDGITESVRNYRHGSYSHKPSEPGFLRRNWIAITGTILAVAVVSVIALLL